MSRLKIAIYPMKIAWADPEENLRNVTNIVNQISHNTDILILPELFSTGYMQESQFISKLAEATTGQTITQIKSLSKQSGLAIAGSFVCRVGNKIFNRCFFIEPSGEETYYDKHHLFSLGLENKIFTPGNNTPPIIRFRGWNISMIVCYDLRFPVWCRNRELSYDVMLVPANWPAIRGYAWEHLIIGRAIENQAIYVAANRGGSDDFGDYNDVSFIVNELGEKVSTVDSNTGLIYAEFDKEQLCNTRKKFPFAADADNFSIE